MFHAHTSSPLGGVPVEVLSSRWLCVHALSARQRCGGGGTDMTSGVNPLRREFLRARISGAQRDSYVLGQCSKAMHVQIRRGLRAVVMSVVSLVLLRNP